MVQQDEIRERRRRLAALLLAGSGLYDCLSSIDDLNDDQFVLITREGLYRLDVSGWMWGQLVVGVLMVLAGILLLPGRRWMLRFAAVVAVGALALHVLLFPYRPVTALLVIGLSVGALRLLWRCRPDAAGRDAAR